MSGTAHSATPLWCDRCGGALAVGAPTDDGHEACTAARALEPPRYCPHCRRRLKVQVLPAGWRATCVQHGPSRDPGPSTILQSCRGQISPKPAE